MRSELSEQGTSVKAGGRPCSSGKSGAHRESHCSETLTKLAGETGAYPFHFECCLGR
jgi:hypothetical protein